MASDPKTIRESNLAMAGLEGRFDFLQKMVWSVIALLGTLIAGAFALYFQLGEIKTDVAVVKANFAALKEQQAAIQESIRSMDNKSQASLTRIETKLSNSQPAPIPQSDAPLNLSDGEVDFIRAMLKLRKTDLPPQVTTIGTIIERSEGLRPLPLGILEKIPRLASYSLAYDANGAALLIANRTRRVEAIVSPA